MDRIFNHVENKNKNVLKIFAVTLTVFLFYFIGDLLNCN